MKQQQLDRRNKVLTRHGNPEQREKRKLRRDRLNIKKAAFCLEKIKLFRLGMVSIVMWGLPRVSGSSF